MQSVQSATTSQTANSASGTAKNTLGKDDFLNLLITQMQNQDPLDPMSGSDYAAQLAQFSSVEQLTNINDNLSQSLSASSVLTSSINNALAATFIGKDVRASASVFQYNGTGTVKLGYSLAYPAGSASLQVYDGAGNLVKTIKGGTSQGDNTLTWDGTNDNSLQAGAGSYSFQVTAQDSTGASVSASPFVYGTVSGVRYKSDGTVFVIDGQEISLSNILEIMQD